MLRGMLTLLLALAIGLNIRDLSWLAGDWQVVNAASCVEEHWTAPSDTGLLGMRRTIVDGRTTEFEFLRIEARGDGIYYVPQPGGRPPVDFKLTSDTVGELVFVNAGHDDRVKRIVYRRSGADRVDARVEGEQGGTPFAFEFAYRRASNNAASRCGAVK